MTNIEHQPKPNTPDEKSPTVDDILGVKDSREGSLCGDVIFRLGKESLIRFFIPMPKEKMDELKDVAAIAEISVSDLTIVALRRVIAELYNTSDWKDRERKYLDKIEPLLPPLPESQKDSAPPAELSD